MITAIILSLYAIGVYTVFTKFLDWNADTLQEKEHYKMLMSVSLLSWGAFIIYFIVKCLNDSEEVK